MLRRADARTRKASNAAALSAEAMTTVFATLILIEFFKAYSFRSDRRSVLERPFANRWLNLAILWELVLLTLVLNVPFLEDAFGTTDLSWQTWLVVVATAVTIVPVLEVAKRVIQARERRRDELASSG